MEAARGGIRLAGALGLELGPAVTAGGAIPAASFGVLGPGEGMRGSPRAVATRFARGRIRHVAGDRLSCPIELGREEREVGAGTKRGGSEEQGLLGGAPADQGVDDDVLAFPLGLAPQVERAGRAQRLALVEAAQHNRAAEIVDPDVEGEGAQRVELVLGERGEDGVGHRGGDLQQVVDEQGLGVRRGDFRPLARVLGVAVADGPAAAGQARSCRPIASNRSITRARCGRPVGEASSVTCPKKGTSRATPQASGASRRRRLVSRVRSSQAAWQVPANSEPIRN